MLEPRYDGVHVAIVLIARGSEGIETARVVCDDNVDDLPLEHWICD